MAQPRLHSDRGDVWTSHERLVDLGQREGCTGHVRMLYARVTRPAQRWVPVGAFCDRCGDVKVRRGDPSST